MNGVCTHIIWLTKQKLTYYTGNFDTYTKTVKENEVIQQKKYEKEQDDIKHLKAFISSCGEPPAAPQLVVLLLQSCVIGLMITAVDGCCCRWLLLQHLHAVLC